MNSSLDANLGTASKITEQISGNKLNDDKEAIVNLAVLTS